MRVCRNPPQFFTYSILQTQPKLTTKILSKNPKSGTRTRIGCLGAWKKLGGFCTASYKKKKHNKKKARKKKKKKKKLFFGFFVIQTVLYHNVKKDNSTPAKDTSDYNDDD